MRISVFRFGIPLGLLLIGLVALLPGRVAAQAGSAFEGLPAEISAGTSASFDFRYVPGMEGIFSSDLIVLIDGATVDAGDPPTPVLLGGVAPVTVTVVSTAANLYRITLDVPADTLTRLTAAGLAAGGVFVLEIFVETDTGLSQLDFRTPADDPGRIRLTGPVAAGAGGGTGGGDSGGGDADGGEMGLPAAGSGGLADVSPVSGASGQSALVIGVLLAALLAAGGTGMARRRR